MKNTTHLIATEKNTQLFNNWNAVIQFLEQLSWKPIEGAALRICGMKSGEWHVEVEHKKENNQPVKKTGSHGIGLHDLSW